MADILYLAHRLPYPPNKGDKVRSYHLLRHLAARHRVHLGTFVDDPDDHRHVEALRPLCASLYAEALDRRVARLRGLTGLVRDEPLTVPYYRSAGLAQWIENTVREHDLRAAIAFSSSMAQYLTGLTGMTKLVDLVDVDSAKWTQYSSGRAWPLSWLYRREGRKLLEFERAVVRDATHAFLVTEAEAELFERLAPDCAGRVDAVGNGVDAGHFSPAREFVSPYRASEMPIVFTGAMDYWPNVDAVSWFASDILPGLTDAFPAVHFYIVGMRPTAAARMLAGDHVTVTGTVPDVRPYLAHARLVVAPLRIARGVQNKVLEAMAMGRPVLASAACAGGIDARPGVDIEVAADAQDFVARARELLGDAARGDALGRQARACVLSRYSWEARLARIDTYLEAAGCRGDSCVTGPGSASGGSIRTTGVAA